MAGRKVKCRFCFKTLNSTEAYHIDDGKQYPYCCSAQEYFAEKIDNENMHKCYEVLYDAMRYRDNAILPNIVKKTLNDLHKSYSFEVILETIQKQKCSIEIACDTKTFNNEFVKCKYVMAIICNSIEDVYKQMKIEEVQHQKDETELEKINSSYVEFENGSIIRPVQANKYSRRNTDISEFLD